MNETQRAVLESLEDGPVTGPELADQLDISRAAVWKQIEALRESGFDIEGEPTGYRFEGVTAYTGPTLEYELEAPFSIEYHETIDSTNARARALAGDGVTDTVVVADEQTGGRGRLDRSWVAPSGGVWLSVLCRPSVPPARAPLYTLVGAVATANAAREAGVDAGIKWPNDVIVPVERETGVDDPNGYRKLAGILTEMEGETDRVEYLVIGIGCNVNIDPETLPAGSTSVRAQVGDVDRRRFVQRLLEAFDRYRTDLSSVVPAWRELAVTLGQRVRIEHSSGTLEGDALDITESGALVLETETGREVVSSGDCEHLRPTV